MTYLPVDVIIGNKAKQIHRIDSLNLLAYVSLLTLVLVTTWFFKRGRRMTYIHETGLAIIYGLIMGACLRYFGLEVSITSINLEDHIPMSVPADYIKVQGYNLGDKNTNKTHVYAYEFRGEIEHNTELGSQISYASVDPEVFFNIILPPIVLNAGLSLKRRHFFRNIGAIFSYAFLGTTISVALVGSLIYGSIHLIKYVADYAVLAEQFSLANCLYFGAIISPTDPLAVLAIFQQLGVDVNLFALVFGESILNDAVSIVLTHSIDHFSIIYGRDPYYSVIWIILECVYNFISMFFTSCLIGILFGIITALTTKFTKLNENPLLETSLLVLMSYASFLIAEVIDASGIVAILLCGITQAHYTFNNLSFEARERIENLFELLTFLCESFLFLAVGVCFWQRGHKWNLTFVAIAFVVVTIARVVSVYPLTVLLNLGRNNKIPMNFQHVIACSGLARGVISYSLASRNTVGDARRIMLSTTSAIVIVSVIFVGSCMGYLVKLLKIPLSNSDCDSSANTKSPGYATIQATSTASTLNNEGNTNPFNNTNGYENASLVRRWRKLDNNFIKPLLTNSQPNLMETMPSASRAIARLLTSDEQLMHHHHHHHHHGDSVNNNCNQLHITTIADNQSSTFDDQSSIHNGTNNNNINNNSDNNNNNIVNMSMNMNTDTDANYDSNNNNNKNINNINDTIARN